MDYVKTSGCDDADGEGTTPLEITVNEGIKPYYIWMEAALDESRVTAAEIKHGPAGWDGFPERQNSAGLFILLARIDTLTKLADHVALIRQFVSDDILTSQSGSCDARWS